MMTRQTIALILLAGMVLGSACLLLLPGRSVSLQDRDSVLSRASQAHWAGTDDLGRDRATRVAGALLLGLGGAISAAAVTVSLAGIVGLGAAWAPAPLRFGLLLLGDLFLSLPWLFLLLMVRAAMPLNAPPLSSAVATFALLAALGWPACARAIFQQGCRLRCAEWMTYAQAAGLRPAQMLRVHMTPHLRTLLLPQFLVTVPAFLVAEANLGALGMGVPEPLPSLGGMLAELSNSALLARSGWIYLPVAVLLLALLLLRALAEERA